MVRTLRGCPQKIKSISSSEYIEGIEIGKTHAEMPRFWMISLMRIYSYRPMIYYSQVIREVQVLHGLNDTG